jgi:hypothetical protein
MIVIASPEADVFSFHCNVCLQIYKERTFTEYVRMWREENEKNVSKEDKNHAIIVKEEKIRVGREKRKRNFPN